MGEATVEETFAAPPQTVFDALQRAAGEVGKTVERVDAEARTVYFNTGLSWSSWTGQNVTASVADDGAGGSRLQVHAQLARRGMSSVQLIDWGESRRIANKVIKAMHRQLGAPA